MKILFIILARGGSKGLPGKNIKFLNNKPLIAYSIECALSSKYCSKVIVSTDDNSIAEISKKYGAEVPFLRPKELSSDTAKSIDAILHCINFCEKNGESYPLIVLLEPTSPLRDVSDVDAAIEELLNHPTALSSVSITKSESAHPDFLFNINDNFLLSKYIKSNETLRRQQLNNLYYPEGSFYICYSSALKKEKTFYIDNFVKGFEMAKWKSFEIDTEEDFIIIESLLLAKLEGKFANIKDINSKN